MTDNQQPVLDGDQYVALVLWNVWLASRVNSVLAWHGVVQFGTSVAMGPNQPTSLMISDGYSVSIFCEMRTKATAARVVCESDNCSLPILHCE